MISIKKNGKGRSEGFMDFWKNCLVCCESNRMKGIKERGLCSDCYKNLRPHKRQRKDPVHSFFHYNGTLRNLILQAKIHGTSRVLTAIEKIWLQKVEELTDLSTVKWVVPAPSSAWSRLRGRVDLAWQLAYSLSCKKNIQFLEPPSFLYWRFKKRALEKNRDQSHLRELNFRQSVKDPTHLVVDDVLTTGHTLSRLSEALPSSYKLKFVTLARSRSHFDDLDESP